MRSGGGGGSSSNGNGHPIDSVGSLLAAVADLAADGLRILSFADKRQWGPDEHEQVRALEELLDEARKDFQELSPLLNGQFNYEHDRTHQSMIELGTLRDRFLNLSQCLKDWSRTGGPINPIWTRDTHTLQRDLHRAQYRAAQRIFRTGQESSARCLGAFLVHRKQRVLSSRQLASVEESEYQRRFVEERRMCSQVGAFLRLGEGDIAFVCDFCDGHLVWEDLERMPSERTCREDVTWEPSRSVATTANPGASPGGNSSWQALGYSKSSHEVKQVVFGPVAIANHIAPPPGDWLARITCPFCEDLADGPRDEWDEEEVWRPENTFDDIEGFQEHLEWQHAPAPTGGGATTWSNTTQNCTLM